MKNNSGSVSLTPRPHWPTHSPSPLTTRGWAPPGRRMTVTAPRLWTAARRPGASARQSPRASTTWAWPGLWSASSGSSGASGPSNTSRIFRWEGRETMMWWWSVFISGWEVASHQEQENRWTTREKDWGERHFQIFLLLLDRDPFYILVIE